MGIYIDVERIDLLFVATIDHLSTFVAYILKYCLNKVLYCHEKVATGFRSPIYSFFFHHHDDGL